MQSLRNTIWTPTDADLRESSMAKFRDYCNHRYRIRLAGYHELHNWSVDPATASDFWMALFEFLDMGATVKPTKVFTKVS
jgi:acetoacetyl-CoA synthetase